MIVAYKSHGRVRFFDSKTKLVCHTHFDAKLLSLKNGYHDLAEVMRTLPDDLLVALLVGVLRDRRAVEDFAYRGMRPRF